MIQIKLDDKACVSCTLCADVCPTKVFSFDPARGLPVIDKPGECFGCLSCAEICPADALEHEGASLAETHYHDPYALKLAASLSAGAAPRFRVPEDPESRTRALRDIGVRLRSVAEVFRQTVGNSLPAVGVLAGRTLARHLPRYQSPESLDQALELARSQFAPAWKIEPVLKGEDALTLTVGECFVRELCTREGIELGGDLCILLYNYVAGYIGQMGKVRLRLTAAMRGPQRCVYQINVHS